METTTVTLDLSSQEYERLRKFAQDRHLEIKELAQVAIAEWLESQARLARARAVMRDLGKGLGSGKPDGNIARTHDEHLYRSKSS